MDENLQRLVRELRSESCPPQVLDRVASRISSERRVARGFRFGVAAAIASLLLLCAVVLWQRNTPQVAHSPARPDAGAQADPALVAQQAREALGYIGHALFEASARTENVILREAMPPLRQSLETAKNKLINRI